MTAVKGAAVLGLCSFTHDSAAALVIDGDLIGFAEEERLVGEKHTSTFPARAVTWLLAEAGITPDEVDAVSYNFVPHRYLGALAQVPRHLAHPATRSRAIPRAHSFARVAVRTRARLRRLSARFPRARVAAVQHHRAHGLYAFASSGFDDAAVLVIDSLGEMQTTTIAAARRSAGHGCEYRIAHAIDDPASLGYAYGAVTEHLGWRRGDEEGTVMALAALGDPARFRDLFARAIGITDTGFVLDPELLALRALSSRYARVGASFAATTCKPRRPHEPVEQVHRDLAAALQERTEQVVVHLARRARRVTGSRRLCLGGGVAANCAAVGEIVWAGLFDEVHVPPAPGDSGTAIGAAVERHLAEFGRVPAGVADRCYLGPAYPDVDLSELAYPGLSAHRPADPVSTLARELAGGRIVGLFQGRLEGGPRALGNRSILASPLLPDVVERLNATVKFREPFRPFAPVVLAEHAGSFFTLPQRAPYMLIASGVTPLTRARIPAVVHANKDRRLLTGDPLSAVHNVVICEAALHPTPGAVSLLFPVDDEMLDAADPVALAAAPRDLTLAYVGNQYDRDDAFDAFFAPAAVRHRHLVAGKWTRTDAWPHVTFVGRVPFTDVGGIYGRSLATVLLLPDRYARAGQMTQRLVEAVLSGCLPLTPAAIRNADRFTPWQLHVDDGADMSVKLAYLTSVAGTSEHAELIAACLRSLALFRVSCQLEVLNRILAGQPSPEVSVS